MASENCDPNLARKASPAPPQCEGNEASPVEAGEAVPGVNMDEETDAYSVHSEMLAINGDDTENEEAKVQQLAKAFESLLCLSPSEGQGQEQGQGRVRQRWVFPCVVRPLSGNWSSDCSWGSRVKRNRKTENLIFGARGSPLGKNGTHVHKKHSAFNFTPAQPFNLQTEQRGQMKEQEFMKKLREMLAREAKRRIPIAQGLPWTTDEPQILPKPPVKGQTKPLDIKLHTQARAIERAEFDHFIAEKIYFLEQQRLEEERLQKLLEMEEIKRLRKEMIPRAQIMPFFDRPFTPRRSTRRLTIPKEPKFHIPHYRRAKCISWNDLYACQQ